ncbi:hypothetical protein F5887DRAFT_925400 [Amanita rubescens]|nr:hypothetical protein F5887DRAFT_925400 [Amanita rubescens]
MNAPTCEQRRLGRVVEENKTLALERSHSSDLMANVQKMHNDLERARENDRRRLQSHKLPIRLRHPSTGIPPHLNTGYLMRYRNARLLCISTRHFTAHGPTAREKPQQNSPNGRGAHFSSATLSWRTTSRRRVRVYNSESSWQASQLQWLLLCSFNLSTNPTSHQRSSVLLKIFSTDLSCQEREGGEGSRLFAQPVQQVPLDIKTAALAPVASPGLTHRCNLRCPAAGPERSCRVRSTWEQISRREYTIKTCRHVEQFKEISQASEALNHLNSTYEDYKASTEAVIAQHEAECAAVQEAFTIRTRRDELQKALNAERAAWAIDKKTLEDTIIDLGTFERNAETDQWFLRGRYPSIRRACQGCRGALFQRSRFSCCIKSIEKLKRDLTTVPNLNARCKDLSEQNKLLHRHLESAEVDAPADSDTKLVELRQVVQCLGKEKGIVDLPLEQENARLKSQERERAVETAASASQHARVSAELGPVKEKSRTSQAELEASKAHVVRLEEENRRWQERHAQLLSKYDHVDPAELEQWKP